jgi:hypothetical protein
VHITAWNDDENQEFDRCFTIESEEINHVLERTANVNRKEGLVFVPDDVDWEFAFCESFILLDSMLGRCVVIVDTIWSCHLKLELNWAVIVRAVSLDNLVDLV